MLCSNSCDLNYRRVTHLDEEQNDHLPTNWNNATSSIPRKRKRDSVSGRDNLTESEDADLDRVCEFKRVQIVNPSTTTLNNSPLEIETSCSDHRRRMCPICLAEFKKRGVLMRHMSDRHYPQFQYFCSKPGCGTVLNRRDKILSHVRTHENWNEFPHPEKFITRELPVPSECPICHGQTDSWKVFYHCLSTHFVAMNDQNNSIFREDITESTRHMIGHISSWMLVTLAYYDLWMWEGTIQSDVELEYQ